MYQKNTELRSAPPTRNDRMAGKLILTDGSTIELTDSAVISGSVSVDNQCVSGQELAFGSVYMGAGVAAAAHRAIQCCVLRCSATNRL